MPSVLSKFVVLDFDDREDLWVNVPFSCLRLSRSFVAKRYPDQALAYEMYFKS
jgi:hypothetical protein